MKIAIQGHPTRCNNVIKILESIGGINKLYFDGSIQCAYYYVDKNNYIDIEYINDINTHQYKLYTLEEFEKEFPFKIGDEVIITNYDNKKGTIINIRPCGPTFSYIIKLETGNGIYRLAKFLKSYKEMKEERNITLTLDKAKEWYNKGGELKEIALQAFTKEELNPLPKSWEEYCKGNKVPAMIFGPGIPNKYVALWKLEQLRDYYRQGWEPDWKSPTPIVSIYHIDNYIGTVKVYSNHFLSFQSEEIAKEFKKNFESLIEEAGDLI